MRYAIICSVLILLGCSEPTGITASVPDGTYYGRDARNCEIGCIVLDDAVDSLHFYTYWAPLLPISPYPALSFDYDTAPSCSVSVHIEAAYIPDSAMWQGYYDVQFNGVPDPVPFTMTLI